MTARIIKNVLPLLLPEGIAAIPPSLASNNSLVTRSAAVAAPRRVEAADQWRHLCVPGPLGRCRPRALSLRLSRLVRQPQSLNSRRPSILSNHHSLTHSLSTSAPRGEGPGGTHANSVCLSSVDGCGVGKRGRVIACLSQVKGKLSTGAPASSRGGGSGLRSLIQSPRSLCSGRKNEIKSATAGTPADSCLAKHTAGRVQESDAHARTHARFPLVGHKGDENLLTSDGGGGGELCHLQRSSCTCRRRCRSIAEQRLSWLAS